MAARIVPCERCGKLRRQQQKDRNGGISLCLDCYQAEGKSRADQREVCPECGAYKHRQSHICKGCQIRQTSTPENYHTFLCKQCGKEKTVHRSVVAKGQGIYCSRSCRGRGSPSRKSQKPMVQCGNCGTPFKKFPSGIKKTKHGKHFCSLECWYEYNQESQHYLWSGGQNERMNRDSRQWHKAVLTRDHHQCRLCHATRKLEVHHILPFRSHPENRWEVSNGITLCIACHRQLTGHEVEHAKTLSLLATIPIEVTNADDEEEGHPASLAQVL